MREFFAGHTLLSREGFSYRSVQAVRVAGVLVVDGLRFFLVGEVIAAVEVRLRLCLSRAHGINHVLQGKTQHAAADEYKASEYKHPPKHAGHDNTRCKPSHLRAEHSSPPRALYALLCAWNVGPGLFPFRPFMGVLGGFYGGDTLHQSGDDPTGFCVGLALGL